MTQFRYFDFGVEATAASFKEMLAGLTGRTVLSGGDLGVSPPDRVVVGPLWLVLDSPRATAQGNARGNLVLHESESRQMLVPTTTNAANYTLMYRHDDVDVEGGTGAQLSLEPGLLVNEAQQNGTVVGYVLYPGGAVPLANSMLVAAPRQRVEALVNPGSGQYVTPPGTGMSSVHAGGQPPIVTNEDDPVFGQCVQVDNRLNILPTIDLLRWTFVVGPEAPGSVSLDYGVDTGQTIGLAITDTQGRTSDPTLPGTFLNNMLVQDFSDVTVELPGDQQVVRRRLRITNGTFQPGRRFRLQATVQTAAGHRTVVTAVGHARWRGPLPG